MQTYQKLLISAALMPLATALYAADAKPSDTPVSDYLSNKPSVVTKVSISAKETFDNNMYLTSVTNGTNIANKETLITSVTPSITTDYTVSAALKINLGYVADVNIYHADSNESYTRHTGTIKLTDTEGDWGYNIAGSFLLNDGSKTAPQYTGAWGSPSIGGGERWGRRAYDLLNGSFSISYTGGNLLVRPVADVRAQIFHTNKSTATGYQNFENRGWNTEGIDLGWKSSSTLTTYIGWRTGHMYQDNYFGVNNNYSNDISRVLLGMEGSINSWWKINLLAGNDSRTFTTAAVALNPLNLKKQFLWSNTSMTLTPTKEDSITFSWVRFLQVASTGRNAYEDQNAEVQWRHTLGSYTFGCGYRIAEGNYLQGSRRDELDYMNFMVGYKFDANNSISIDYQHTGCNNSVANGAALLAANPLNDVGNRGFSRNIFSFTYKLAL